MTQNNTYIIICVVMGEGRRGGGKCKTLLVLDDSQTVLCMKAYA